MISKNERIFLSRTSLSFLFIFFLIITLGWNWILALCITYPILGIISFFIHATRLGVKKSSVEGVFFLILSPVLAQFLLLYSVFLKKEK